MKVCVVGSGGREHALCLALSRTAEVVCTPGNPGIAGSTSQPVEEIEADLYVIGPEAPLVDGLADRLRAMGRLVFGPGADGARLEGSKAWMKDFAERHGIASAAHATFDELEPALDRLRSVEGPWVIKTDGLAAGKGVLVTHDLAQAEADVRDKLSGAAFGEAGRRVVIEDYLDGPEVSVLAVCDGRRAVALVPAQDFKRAGDGDAGPNTGGMGAYSPVPVVDKGLLEEIDEDFVQRAIQGLAAEGIDYRGVLYVGLALTSRGPKLVEFNVRFGDPETQVLLPRMTSDLAALLHEAAAGEICTLPEFTDEATVVVVAASAGYPGEFAIGHEIHGMDDASAMDGVQVIQAGTAWGPGGEVVSAGGRVLGVTGTGPDLASARRRAYEGLSHITFEGMQYRSDIAEAAAVNGEAAEHGEQL